MSRNKHTKKPKNRQLFEYSLIAVAIVVLVFIVSYAIQINQGIAKETSSPSYSLRIEILNAGAENGLEEKLKTYLNELEIDDIELEIVNVSRFTIQPSKETFIMSNRKNSEGVVELAKILQMDIEKIQYSELSYNKNHLDATIVIGTDSLLDGLLEKSEELN